jgi:ubiquinone/menaquinone biosynthesis C-methylase UbiE
MSSNADWQAWGAVDPMYGVATLPGRSGSWSQDEFLELGASDWMTFRPHWESYGLGLDSCLEIGCGAGRMTAQLACDFTSVDAVDVSPGMLEAAKATVHSDRVRFHLADGTRLPVEDSSTTSAFSVHVFQHFASAATAARCFSEIHRALVEGGTFMIHLPIVSWPHGRFNRSYERLERVAGSARGIAVHARRLAYRAHVSRRPPMAMRSYEVGHLNHTLRELGFRDVEIRVVFSDSQMAHQHPFVFARKS